ncbi:hypothetical protein C772_01491 [Bhargavaea cecembensis DSE10]|uniref:Translation elongation factor EF-1alpha n=1 Tax=Bhargavaea cecembensis DSE10 TaxID=1235279 RepID=M7NHD1_9BACL|nr:DUF5058 family protein [Bhargavaea cecembensis]EMR06596.1 hypothetical protein C772_01491 [Bhargavaea cecembensis DSE10]
MNDVMRIANSYPLWIIASLVIGLVFFQAFKFISLATKTSASVGMSKQEVKTAIRAGAISSIGPSFAIIIIAISLLSLIGNPVTLVRIGIIGSAPIETVGASLGAEAAGAELGAASFTAHAFTNAVWVMCLGGLGWLLFTALFTKSLGKVQAKTTSTPKNLERFKIISTAAMIGAFSYLGSGQMIKGYQEAIVLLVAFMVMPIILQAAKKFEMKWLVEWSLGLVILVGLAVGYLLS